MTVPSPQPTARVRSSTSDTITALVVDDDQAYRERVASVLEGDDLTIQTAASIPETVASLDDVDCLVSDPAAVRNESVDEFLDRVAGRPSELSVLFLLDRVDESATVVDAVTSYRWVDCLVKGDSTAAVERLGQRVHTLVERRQLETLSERSFASIELARDAIAIVGPDGDVDFANRSFAMQFGYDRDAIIGRPWQTLFTDDSVERLETAAIPTVVDGWRWTGTCTGRRKTGTTVTVNVRLGGPDDGSLVFVVDTATNDGDGATN